MRFVHNITKEYPDMIKIIIMKEPYALPDSSGSIKRSKEIVDEDYIPDITSLNRTKVLIKDIILCNNFEYFCTFTFAPDKVNRYSFSACFHKINVWIHHQADNSRLQGKKFEYLLVPEQHKDGAWHFHALISGYTGRLRPSGVFSSTHRPIYNITSFRSGFTTCVAIDDKALVGNYVSKYITKDFIQTFNQRRFFCSRGLIRPKREVNSKLFRIIPPLFRRRVAENQDTITYTASGDLSLLLGCGYNNPSSADQWSDRTYF